MLASTCGLMACVCARMPARVYVCARMSARMSVCWRVRAREYANTTRTLVATREHSERVSVFACVPVCLGFSSGLVPDTVACVCFCVYVGT